MVATLSFLKSTQIMNFPFFLSTTPIGDNQVASSTCSKNLATNNFVNILFDNGHKVEIQLVPCVMNRWY